MKTSTQIAIGFLLLVYLSSEAIGQPAPQPFTFQFTFCAPQSQADARGYITFEESLLQNPFSGEIEFPDPQVIDLSVTVSGASSGNGTFGINEFESILWDSNGATLDFGQELVGQPTPGQPFGTPAVNNAGDFNFNRAISSPSSPDAFDAFSMAADGGGADELMLRSMIQGSASNGTASCGLDKPLSIPTISDLGILVLILLLGSMAGIVVNSGVYRA